MANINSYAENMAQLTKAASEILDVAQAINATVTGNDEEVVVTDDVVLPSFQNVLNRVERVERTMSRFVAGKGVIETGDGTYRKINVESISRPANDIINSFDVTTFDIDPNWFFESFQYPRCVVKIDLAGSIDEESDRVYLTRLIIDTNQSRVDDTTKTDILSSTLSYGEMIQYLDDNYIEYKEDRDEVRLPLNYEKFNGSFQVTGINLIKNQTTGLNHTWYYLSNIDYASVDSNGARQESGHILQVNDYLRFNNTLFKIIEINQQEMRIRLEYNVGYDTISLYDTLEFYNDPFKEQIISIGIGIDEINIIYLKGVNEKFNLLSREWSNPIIFESNSLIYSKDSNVNMTEYYTQSVADFGRMWISQIKEGRLPAYGSKTPNAPVLNESDLRVVQINTQLESALDTEKYNSITSEIASVKSNITATRNTIVANKNKLITEYDSNRRDVITNSITSDTDKLNNLTTQFSSLVDELNTLLNDAGAINYTPKYHVRGFFAIPEPQYSIEDKKIGKQDIIGFETMYRYLHVDETGSKLNTFSYTDASNNIVESGVFTDWTIISSPVLEKQYNETTDTFEWVSEKNDGTHVTINQIDIPIRSGEKVEIKVRSVSEAGYPYSPLKSNWSNSIIMSFPDNLTTDDSVTTILENVKSDMTSVVLQETLSAAGLYTHISDNNSRYKHSADNIEYTETTVDSSGNTTVVTMSLAEKIRSMSENNAENQPGVNFELQKDSSIYKGHIKILVPTLAKNGKQLLERDLCEYLNTSIYPFMREKLNS